MAVWLLRIDLQTQRIRNKSDLIPLTIRHLVEITKLKSQLRVLPLEIATIACTSPDDDKSSDTILAQTQINTRFKHSTYSDFNVCRTPHPSGLWFDFTPTNNSTTGKRIIHYRSFFDTCNREILHGLHAKELLDLPKKFKTAAKASGDVLVVTLFV